MNSYFQHFDNLKFSDIYKDKETFLNDYNNLGFPKIFRNEETPGLLYVLLVGRFTNSHIKNYDVNQFKYQLFSTVWQYGGTWEKDLDIQKKLRELSLEEGSEIYIGGKAIYNSATNPGTDPSTNDSDELPFINGQNVTHYKKSKIEGLSLLSEMLKNDVTEPFLRRFDKLFKSIIFTGRTLLYTTEGD